MSKLTEALRTVGVYNATEFYGGDTPREQVYIGYRAETGRSPFTSRALVYRLGYRTDKANGHWSDQYNKAFHGFDLPRSEPGTQKDKAVRAAQAWAGPRYGITEWKRDPFGSFGDAEFVTRRVKALREQAKAKATEVTA